MLPNGHVLLARLLFSPSGQVVYYVASSGAATEVSVAAKAMTWLVHWDRERGYDGGELGEFVLALDKAVSATLDRSLTR